MNYYQGNLCNAVSVKSFRGFQLNNHLQLRCLQYVKLLKSIFGEALLSMDDLTVQD